MALCLNGHYLCCLDGVIGSAPIYTESSYGNSLHLKFFSAILILPLSPFFPPTLLSILSTFWKQKSMETCHFQADLAFFNPYHTIMYLRKIIIKIFKTFLTTSHITLTHSKKESFWYHLNRVW